MAESGYCMAGLPPTKELIGLKIPYGAWEPDTLITDTFGNPIFSVLDVQHHAMGAYEAIFGDENGHKLCYVKRRLITKYWKDGWDFCTYRPNFPGQPKYKERDMYGKSVYPFSFLLVKPLKCRYAYCVHKEDMESMDTQLEAMHGWLGSMTVCCTPMVRLGKWQIDFHRPGAGDPEINIDQSKNLLEVESGNDLLAALCIAYAFDKALCQPLVTIIGYQEKEHPDDDDDSFDSYEEPPRDRGMEFDEEEPPAYPMLAAAPEEEEEFEPAGYLGYEDPEEEEEQPEVDGYLEDTPDEESEEEEEEFEPAGYLADSTPPPDNEEPAGYLESQPDADSDERAGYLESQPDTESEEPAGYLESQPDTESEEPAGYLESQPDADDEEPAGYIQNQPYRDDPDQNSDSVALLEADNFKDEDDDLD